LITSIRSKEYSRVRIVANLCGGRGSQSGYSTFKFSGNSDNDEPSIALPPARMNTQIKAKTYEEALKAFQKNHQLSDREYMVQVDDNGFVYAYNKGGRGSVSPYSRNVKEGVQKNSMLIHNHPKDGWDIFSSADLTTTAGIRNAKGIVATSYGGKTFTITKGTHFNATRFTNAVNNAKLRGLDYNHAVDNWLTANQKRYGYKYKSQNYRNPSRTRKGSVSLDLPF